MNKQINENKKTCPLCKTEMEQNDLYITTDANGEMGLTIDSPKLFGTSYYDTAIPYYCPSCGYIALFIPNIDELNEKVKKFKAIEEKKKRKNNV